MTGLLVVRPSAAGTDRVQLERRDKKQIPKGNDRKKGKDSYDRASQNNSHGVGG
jgi:hypothetical protein